MSHRLALVILIVLLTACSQPADASPGGAETSTEAASPPSARASEEASPTEDATPTPVPLEVREYSLFVPITITVPADWRRIPESTDETLLLAGGTSGLGFHHSASQTVDQWVERLRSAAAIEVTEPQPVEVGGAPGVMVDITLTPEATGVGCFGSGRCYPLFGGVVGWIVEDRRPTRVWIVDVRGQTVVIATDAAERQFENWVARIEEVLDTLEWGS